MKKSEYPRCATCRFWNTTWGFGNMGVTHRRCQHPLVGKRDSDGSHSARVFGTGTVDINTEVATAADFGCIHHEERTE